MNTDKLIFISITIITVVVVGFIINASFRASPATNESSSSVADVDFLQNNPNTKGKKDAVLTIVEFSDFQCPYCGGMAPILDEVLAKYPDDVLIVFKQFPLINIHKGAFSAALASEAAAKQGQFWQYHDKLFGNQHEFTDKDLEKYANELGLDMDKFKSDMSSSDLNVKVKADMSLGRSMKIRGTPSLFFVYGTTVTPVKLKSGSDFILQVDNLVSSLKDEKGVTVGESTTEKKIDN